MRSMLWAAAAGLAASRAAQAQTTPPEIPFDSVPDFFKLPENTYFGEVAGIAVNSQNHVFVLSRGDTSGPAYGAAATQLLEFDQDGKARAKARAAPALSERLTNGLSSRYRR
jgi:hypothetical protein